MRSLPIIAWFEISIMLSSLAVMAAIPDSVVFGLDALIIFSVYKFLLSAFAIEPRPISTVFWLYHAFFLLIPGWMQVTDGYYPWVKVTTDVDMERALRAVLLGVTFFAFAYELGKRKIPDLEVRMRSSDFVGEAIPMSQWRAVLVIVGVLPALAVVGILGPGSFLQDRGDLAGMVYGNDGLALLYNLAKFAVFAVALALGAYYVNKKNSKKRRVTNIPSPWLSIATVGVSMIALLVNSPISSPRFHFLGMILAAFLIFRPMKTRLSRGIFWTSAAVFLYTLFPGIKNISAMVEQGTIILPDVASYLKEGIDFDGLQQLANISRLVDAKGILYGTNFISAVLFWVPRSIWGGKADVTGAVAADFAGYDYTNLSSPLVGEALYGFGIIGVAVFFSWLGWQCSKMDSRYRTSLQDRFIGRDRLLVGTIVGFLFIVLRGALNAVFPQIGVSLVVIYVLAPKLAFRRKVTPKPQSADGEKIPN